jgi:rhodanese-related sulfurtransferase
MIEQISPKDFSEWIEKHATNAKSVLLVDVRENWEFETAKVQAQGFELLHVPMQSVPAHLGEMDKSRPIAVLCHHGSRSQHVATFLEQNGFEMLANISGGIHAWSQERDPTVPTY